MSMERGWIRHFPELFYEWLLHLTRYQGREFLGCQDATLEKRFLEHCRCLHAPIPIAQIKRVRLLPDRIRPDPHPAHPALAAPTLLPPGKAAARSLDSAPRRKPPGRRSKPPAPIAGGTRCSDRSTPPPRHAHTPPAPHDCDRRQSAASAKGRPPHRSDNQAACTARPPPQRPRASIGRICGVVIASLFKARKASQARNMSDYRGRKTRQGAAEIGLCQPIRCATQTEFMSNECEIGGVTPCAD